MNKLLIPNRYYKDIFSINYDLLKQENIKYLLFDLDNTLGDSKESVPSKEVIELFQKLKEDFTLIIITNALPLRAKRYGEILGVEVFYLSRKPSRRNYLKIMSKYNANEKELVGIGDQIYTDIKGANRLDIKSIFLDPISKNESILTKPNRVKEKILIYKKGIIKRGEYYE